MKFKTLFLTPLLLFFIAYSVRITASDASYGPVQPNENLWTISGQHQAAQGSQQLKWIMAFYNANPDAFIKGNINLLKLGTRLRVPSLQQVEAVDQTTALKTLVLHNLLQRSGTPVVPGPAATSEEAKAIQQRNTELLNRIQAMTGEMEGFKSQASQHQQQVTDLKNQIGELQTQLTQAKADNADLKARMGSGDQTAQAKADSLRQELEAKLNSRIRELEGVLAQSKGRVEELEANLKTAQEAQKAATGAKSEKEVRLEAQIVQLKAELAETQNQVKKLEGLKGQASQLQQQVTDLKTQVGELQTQLTQAKAENSDLRARMSSGDQAAQAQATTLRQELEAKLNGRIQELESSLTVAQEAQKVAASAKSEKEAQLEAQIVRLKAELTEAQNQVKKLEAQLKAAEKKVEATPAPAVRPAPAPPAQAVAEPAETVPVAAEAKPLWQDPAILGIGAVVLMLLSWLIGKKSGTGSDSSAPALVSASGPVRQPSKDDEILTKLDMARAYVEMGNTKAARAVLQEVMSEGNDKAKKKARDMLAHLNKAA